MEIKRTTININGEEIKWIQDLAKATASFTDEELDNLVNNLTDEQLEEFGWQAIRFCWSASPLKIEDFGGVEHWNRLTDRLVERYRVWEEKKKQRALEELRKREQEEWERKQREKAEKLAALEAEATFEIVKDEEQTREDKPAYPVVKVTTPEGKTVEVELFIGGFSAGNSISRILKSNIEDEAAKALAWKALDWYKLKKAGA